MGTWSSEESAHVLQHSSHRKCSQHPHPVSLAAIRRPASLGEPVSGLFVAIAHTAASNVFFPGRVVFELGLVVTNGPSTFACVFDFHSSSVFCRAQCSLADFVQSAALGLGPVRTLNLAGDARRHGARSNLPLTPSLSALDQPRSGGPPFGGPAQSRPTS